MSDEADDGIPVHRRAFLILSQRLISYFCRVDDRFRCVVGSTSLCVSVI